jgi:hypothetical protein
VTDGRGPRARRHDKSGGGEGLLPESTDFMHMAAASRSVVPYCADDVIRRASASQ